MKKKRMKTVWKGIFALLILLALGWILACYDKAHFMPFSSEIKLNDPKDICISDNGSVVIDNTMSRLLFLDNDMRVNKIIDLLSSSSPIGLCSKVQINDGKVYVISIEEENSGLYLSNETIEVFDLDGNYLEQISSKDYSEEDFVCMLHNDGFLYSNGSLKVIQKNDREIRVTTLNESSEESDICFNLPETVFKTFVDSSCENIISIGRSLSFYKCNLETKDITIISDKEAIELLGLKDSMSCCKLLEAKGYGELYNTNLHIINSETGRKNLIFVDSQSNKLEVYDYSSDNIDTYYAFKITPGLWIKNLLYYLSLVYLAVWLVIGLIWLICNLNLYKYIKEIIAVLVLFVVVAFYSYSTYKTMMNDYDEKLKVCSRQIATSLSAMYDSESNGFVIGEEEEISKYLSDICKANGKKVSIYATVGLLAKMEICIHMLTVWIICLRD